MWPLISASLFVGLTLAFGPIAEAQDDADMSGDSHFQEELGINRFTTPSIEPELPNCARAGTVKSSKLRLNSRNP